MTTVIDLLSPRDAGALLGITSAGVIKLALRGKLPELRDSAGRRLFRRKDVLRLRQRREAGRTRRVTS